MATNEENAQAIVEQILLEHDYVSTPLEAHFAARRIIACLAEVQLIAEEE